MRLFVGIHHQPRFGDTAINIFATRELAELERQRVARDNWTALMTDKMPADPAAAADLYFDRMSERRGDYYSIDAVDVVGLAADRQDIRYADLMTGAMAVADAFPEIGTDQPLSGAEAVDRLNDLIPPLRDAVAQAQAGAGPRLEP